MMDEDARHESGHPGRATAWGWWALCGCFAWIFLMLTVDWPIGILLTPAAGPLCGWAAGGLFVLLFGERG